MGRVSTYPVLLIDDEPQFLQSVAVTLRVAGYDVVTCSDGNEALQLIKSKTYGVVVLDILMPTISGLELLPQIVQLSGMTSVIMLTAVNDIATAIECMRHGAFDYLLKPVERDRLITTVRRAIEMVELKTENNRLKSSLLAARLEHPEIFEPIITRDSRMISIFHYIEAVAPSPMPVLVQGETGTGKELIARSIHQSSERKGDFVSVNVAGLGDSLFCDTLFGHVKGAYTGADSKRDGLVARAAQGTLFLDEIGDLAPESQVKLLRLLEERTYYPHGSDSIRSCEARIIAATSRNLQALQMSGTFRSDLFYRLDAHTIVLPPLRERRGDIPLLIDAFVEQAAAQLNRPVPKVTDTFYELFTKQPFPGNIRELRNLVFDAVSKCNGDTIGPNLLIGRLANTVASGDIENKSTFLSEIITQWPHLPSMKELEQAVIADALRRSSGNQTMAAQFLGMTRSALNKRLIRSRNKPAY